MNLESLLDQLGTERFSVLTGIVVGLMFGVFAQQSRFCLRAACVEFWRGQAGGKFAIWLLAFSAALIATQFFINNGSIAALDIRQLNSTGTMSGAIIGGLFFGAGMILARGCASRLLVLSATGNMRALIAGLVVTVAAQASLRGGLSPAREKLSGLWLINSHDRGMANFLPDYSGLIIGIAILVIGVWFARRHKIGPWLVITSVLTGLSITAGWLLNSWHHSNSFDIVPIKSVSFTGPSADTLMGLINSPSIPLNFDTGLVPGVFLGSFLAAVISKEFKWQQFDMDTGQARYLIGAAMMGFGGMLAGGCAVGAGVTGGSLLVTTAWVALLCMWLAAGATDWLVDRSRVEIPTVQTKVFDLALE